MDLKFILSGCCEHLNYMAKNNYMVVLKDKEVRFYLGNQVEGIKNQFQLTDEEIASAGIFLLGENQYWTFNGGSPQRNCEEGHKLHIYGNGEEYGPTPVTVADHLAEIINDSLPKIKVSRFFVRPNVMGGDYNSKWEELGFSREEEIKLFRKRLSGKEEYNK
ncbi:hypothetical protein HOC13_00610 [Candidatus Woesearchaeota archaeon]|jgi:hypothetical protein|nr:hypothetical protein [Candidatus Woesearchaeota archaeon]